jgi:PAS domain S-box-containing protein
MCLIDRAGQLCFANGPLRLVLGLNLLNWRAAQVHPDDAAQLARLAPDEPARRLHIRFPNVAGGWVRIELDCQVAGLDREQRVLAASPSLSLPTRGAVPGRGPGDAIIGVYVIDRGRFTYVNGAFERITGYSSQELVGSRALDLVLPEDRRELLRSAARVIAGDRWLQYEFRIRTKAGAIRWLTENLAPLTKWGTRATLGSCLDVSGWRAAAEALREGGRRLAEVNQATHDMLALTGPAGRFLFVNDTHAEVLGYKPRELLGTSALALLHPEDRAVVSAAIAEWGPESESRLFEVRVAHHDGHWIWIETRVEVIREAAGRYNGSVIISRDITLRRRVEQELQTIAQELRAPTEALAAFAYRAARGEASALFLVSAYAQLLARRYDGTQANDADTFVRAVAHQTSRLQSLVVDLIAAGSTNLGLDTTRRAA